MLATDGHFTFVASKPQLACAAFVIAEPSEVISLELYDVNVDCSAGDFIKVWLRCAAGSSPHGPANPALLSSRSWFLVFLSSGTRGIKMMSDEVKAALRGRALGASAVLVTEWEELPLWWKNQAGFFFSSRGLKSQRNKQTKKKLVCFNGCLLL